MSKSNINTTLWVARYQPTAIIIATVLSVCIAVGLYIVFTHNVVHGHGKLPTIGWYWGIPAMMLALLTNLRISLCADTLEYVWRIGPVKLHQPITYEGGKVHWNNVRGKNKTYQLRYHLDETQHHIITLNQKGAIMVSTVVALLERSVGE
ncbi:hypothetical protein [Aliidiomarina quisquiliarum]|uniref:hypothetical protein n=1 Tax=Aliidiomarina quisquiliarum TaxID=2938947 RepID=UPI00208EF9CD|nr:hypothetical protein [Aliidiomarina quisquiliarum]